MAMRTKLLGSFGIAILGVGAIVAIRTMQFAPTGVAASGAVKLAAPPPFDLPRAASNLSRAVQFQTISHQDPSENQSDQWSQFQAWLQSTYPAVHRTMTREIVGGALLYKWEGSSPAAPAIIVMAHQDVVPVTPGTEGDWKHPPFDGQIAQDAVWGRGSVDDKGSLIGLFEALEALAKAGFRPKRTVYLVSGHDEEAGGSGARAVATLLEARGVKALFTIDEGSATILDAPVINGPAILIGIAEKGYATLKVTATSEGGHSSMPPKETGVINLAKAIIAINDKPFPLELKGPGEQMLGSLAAKQGGITKIAMANQWLLGSLVVGQAGGTPSGAAMLHTTIAPTMLQGSPKENVLPQEANALINYRITPWNRASEVMARAKAAVRDMPVTLSWVKPPREPSKISSTSSLGWKLVSATAQADAPDAALAPYLVVAGTDSRSFERVSADVYRFMPMHFRIADTKMIHGTNEHMDIDSFKRMITFYARLIATSAG
jgi:carboxypeptidase PM20D1